MGRTAALGATGAATIATGPGPNAGRGEGLERTSQIANKTVRRRRAHACARRVDGSVDNVRALDWRAGHPTLRPRHEAHLSAQEAQARPHPRVPRAHEHAGGPPDAQAPPRQGPQAADRLSAVDAAARRRPAPEARRASRAARSSSASIAEGRSTRQPLPRRSTRSRARPTASRPTAPRSGVSVLAQGRRRRRSQQGQAPAARGLRDARPSGLPAEHDVRRRRAPEVRELGRARGPGGRRAARWPSSSRGRRRRRARWLVMRRARPSRRSSLYQRVISPALPRRCKYEPTCSAYAVQAIRRLRHTARAGAGRRGGCCAATRSATAASIPWRPSACSAARDPQPDEPCSRSPTPVQPLIDVFDRVLVFFHDTVGLRLGLLDHRADDRASGRCPDPADAQAVQVDAGRCSASRRRSRRCRPSTRTTSQRLNQEMMKFYQENKVNPFGSCLPAGAAAPGLLLAVLHAAKGPQARHLPGHRAATRQSTGRAVTNVACNQVGPREREVPLHPGPDRPGDRRRPGRSCSSSTSARSCSRASLMSVDGRPQPALHHDRAAVRLRALHPELPGRPARLLDHDELLDRRPAVRHPAGAGLPCSEPRWATAAAAARRSRRTKAAAQGQDRRSEGEAAERRAPSGDGDDAAPEPSSASRRASAHPAATSAAQEEDREAQR